MSSDCLFCRIAEGSIPSTAVYSDETLYAFRDIHPAAPVHVLVIPRRHIARVSEAQASDAALLGEMVLCAKQIAEAEGIAETGYRLVFNCNDDGGQTVFHVHLHLLGGRAMSWPPG